MPTGPGHTRLAPGHTLPGRHEKRRPPVVVGILGLLTVMGCSEATSPGGTTPVIVSVVEAPDSANHLAAVPSYTEDGADSVRLVYRADTVAEAATPYDRSILARGQLVVLGLVPHTAYYRGHLEAQLDTRLAAGCSFDRDSKPKARVPVTLRETIRVSANRLRMPTWPPKSLGHVTG